MKIIPQLQFDLKAIFSGFFNISDLFTNISLTETIKIYAVALCKNELVPSTIAKAFLYVS